MRASILLAIFALTTVLNGCGSDDGSRAASTPTPTPPDPQAACAALDGRALAGADLTAALVPASATYAEYCKVTGVIAPQLHFAARLPSEWSGRALFMGGGGLNGLIIPPEQIQFNPSIGNDGYAVIATDSGHQGTPIDGAWALNDPEAVENFAYRAIHTVLGVAHAIIETRYGRRADHVYFFGESTGGREGLIAAQRWPDDFDGIVSLEPVYNMTALVLAENRIAHQVFTVPGARLSTANLQALGSATLAACDGLDGLEDGIIGDIAACRFDPASLRCDGAPADTCLTDVQIDTVNVVRSQLDIPVPLANGVDSYPGWPIGHEDNPGGWPSWVTGLRAGDPAASLGASISGSTLRYLIAHDASLDPLHFSASTYADELRGFSELVDATDPDLSAFAAHGGKLILWHGWADYAVSAYSTVRYYEQVMATMGTKRTEEFVRFYTSPGVDHLAGGPGAGSIDFLAAITTWVESDTAPDDLIATRTAAPRLSRPLCRYPRYPRYDGSGDPREATSFECVSQ